jgi:hypothetical protein
MAERKPYGISLPVEPSVPLSAIRALVQQCGSTCLIDSELLTATKWRDRWVDAEEDNQPPMLDAQIVAYLVGEAEQFRKLVTQLAALCPAPPEDRK